MQFHVTHLCVAFGSQVRSPIEAGLCYCCVPLDVWLRLFSCHTGQIADRGRPLLFHVARLCVERIAGQIADRGRPVLFHVARLRVATGVQVRSPIEAGLYLLAQLCAFACRTGQIAD